MDRTSGGTINKDIEDLNQLDLTGMCTEHYRKQEKNIYNSQAHMQHFLGQAICEATKQVSINFK